MQREEILKKLREQGCRITKQRQLLLNIILQEECTCCTLEDIGAISRNTMYRIDCGDDCLAKDNCEVKLNDGTSLELTQAQWNQVIASGLKACGFQS